jgi:serine/threonine protein phosphatase PrpC
MSQAWVWAGARAIGTAHLTQGLPCQDAFACRIWQEGAHPAVLIAALADGAGSAECAEVGAQLATSLVVNIVSEQLMDGTAPDQLANVLRFAVGEARLALQPQAGHAGRVIDDYACTLLVAILSVDGGIVGQIGDGAVVIDGTAHASECAARVERSPALPHGKVDHFRDLSINQNNRRVMRARAHW